MLEGDREFPSIATKTRPANDALMDYSLDVIWLHMSLFWLYETATTSIYARIKTTEAERPQYCTRRLFSDTAILKTHVYGKVIVREQQVTRFRH